MVYVLRGPHSKPVHMRQPERLDGNLSHGKMDLVEVQDILMVQLF